ncbi:MAG: histidine phosphatase family protein [Bdellovibrionia bacterium]
MKILELYVFRHGETDWNLQKKLQGHTDIPLNATGVRQAEALGHKLKEFEFESIVTSDLSRARATAEAVNAHHGVKIEIDSRLRECHLGSVEGMHKDELLKVYGEEVWQKWLEGRDPHFSFPGGENTLQHRGRLFSVIQKVAQETSTSRAVGLSTHGGSIKRIVSSCYNIGDNAILIPNCSTYHLRYHSHGDQLEFVRAIFL